MSNRIPIEEEMQRLLRQVCGFGCVVCGCPVYEIHHIEPYATVPEHRLEGLALLCPTHHSEATRGLLTPAQVTAWRKAPINLARGKSKPHRLWLEGGKCTVWLGDSDAVNLGPAESFSPIVIDGFPLLQLRFVQGQLLLNMVMYNERDQAILLSQNGFLQYTPNVWDISFRGRTLTMRDAPRRIRLRITIDPPETIRISHALFLRNGVAVKVAPTGICCLNLGGAMSFDGLCSKPGPHQVGLAFGEVPQGLIYAAALLGIPRYAGLRLNQRISSPRGSGGKRGPSEADLRQRAAVP